MDANNRIGLYCTAGTVVAQRIVGGVTVTASAAISGTAWHQFAVVWDPLVAGSLKLYVDRHLAATATDVGSIAAAPGLVVLGKNAAASSGYWRGRLARMGLWHVALTDLELDSLYPADWATWEVH